MNSEAWDDINPPMASAQPQEPQSPCSETPANNELFRDQLTACLALVAPAGMTEEARRDWLAVAWGTLRHLPADLLAAGCAEARKVADHPSKIVPIIVAYAEPRLDSRKRFEREYPSQVCLPPPPKHVMERDRSKFGPNDWRELNQHLERMGSAVRYTEDGTRTGGAA
jgi:hypothetical protein